MRLNLERLAEITARVREELDRARRGDLRARRARSSRSARRSSSGEILFEKLGLSRKRRGKTGYSTDARVLQAIRAEHEIVPKIERWRELSTLIKTYLDVLPHAGRRALAHPHDLPAGRSRRPGACRAPTRTCRTCPIRTPLGREIRGCFEAEHGQRADLRRLLADRAARARARRRRARAEGDLQARRGRAHGDRLAGLRRRRRADRPRACARRRR